MPLRTLQIYRVAWLLAIGALMILGAIKVVQSPRGFSEKYLKPEGSINSVLESYFGQPELANRVHEFLEKLPPGPLVVAWKPTDVNEHFAVSCLGYLAWPREFVLWKVSPEELTQAVPNLAQKRPNLILIDQDLAKKLPTRPVPGTSIRIVVYPGQTP